MLAISVNISSEAFVSIVLLKFLIKVLIPVPFEFLSAFNFSIENSSKKPSNTPDIKPFQNACFSLSPLASASLTPAAAADNASIYPPPLPSELATKESTPDIAVL